MARVEQPRWDSAGEVECFQCPFETTSYQLCYRWRKEHQQVCPTAETYSEACRIAEEATR